VHVPAGLVVAVLPVVVGGRQGSLGRERGPLEPLVGALLPRSRVDHGQLAWIRVAPGEGGPGIAGDAEHDLVVAGSGCLGAGVEVAAAGGRVAAVRHTAVALVRVAVDVGGDGDHDLVGVGRVHPAGGVVRRPEYRVLRGALLRDTGHERVGALGCETVGQFVV